MNPIQVRIKGKYENVEETFVSNCFLIAQRYPQYSMEYVMNDMPIPMYLGIVNHLNKQFQKKNKPTKQKPQGKKIKWRK